jgi:hypothetical protein
MRPIHRSNSNTYSAEMHCYIKTKAHVGLCLQKTKLPSCYWKSVLSWAWLQPTARLLKIVSTLHNAELSSNRETVHFMFLCGMPYESYLDVRRPTVHEWEDTMQWKRSSYLAPAFIIYTHALCCELAWTVRVFRRTRPRVHDHERF